MKPTLRYGPRRSTGRVSRPPRSVPEPQSGSAFLNLGARRCRTLAKARADLDFRRERAMDGAAVGDLQQPLALRLVERPFQHDLPVDLIDLAVLGLAVGAILGVDLVVLQPDPDLLQRPVLLPGVHAQGHGRAG